MDFSHWSALKFLKPDFVKNVKSVFIFGIEGTEVLMMTHDDLVYGLGMNKGSCLGLPEDAKADPDPVLVYDLCHLQISEFIAGYHHTVALTLDGKLYTFGSNVWGQLGVEPGNSRLPSLLNKDGEMFVQVACGTIHNLAVNDKGFVYSWGSNNYGQCGSGRRSEYSAYAKVSGDKEFQQSTFHTVACTNYTSFALTTMGVLYAWGDNEYYNLGEDGTCVLRPTLVPRFRNKFVTNIVCGSGYSLALTRDKKIFAWGCNDFGQLGLGTSTALELPLETAKSIGSVAEIVAVLYCNISVAKTMEGKIYMWGRCRKGDILTPTETKYRNIYEVFKNESCTAVTPGTLRSMNINRIYIDNCLAEKTLVESYKRVFDKEEHSDFKIIVVNKPIYVYKTILKIRSEHFNRILKERKSGSSKDFTELTLDGFGYSTYRAYIYYLYTGEVMVEPGFAVDLISLANMFEEENLKKKCADIIKDIITTDNVIEIYCSAIKYGIKELEEECLEYISKNVKSVVKSKGFFNMDPKMSHDLIIKAADKELLYS